MEELTRREYPDYDIKVLFRVEAEGKAGVVATTVRHSPLFNRGASIEPQLSSLCWVLYSMEAVPTRPLQRTLVRGRRDSCARAGRIGLRSGASS